MNTVLQRHTGHEALRVMCIAFDKLSKGWKEEQQRSWEKGERKLSKLVFQNRVYVPPFGVISGFAQGKF
eukprot:13677712-Ditylum_brightwellii.AAC.1